MQVALLAQPQRRAGSLRSRTGCMTCKRRRIKCDEAFPCARCTKARLQCEGPDSRPVSKNKSTLADSERNARSFILPRLEGMTTLSHARPSAVLPNETEIEYRYLRYFQQQTSTGFQSAWDWTLWNRLMLQGCHHEPFMRYAVVAIGALHKSLRASSPAGREPGNNLGAAEDQSMGKLHREYAFLMYGKALQKMQLAIASDPGRRHALLACLLIVCFESHTGNRYKALCHAKFGLQIMQQWDSQDSHGHGKKKLDVDIESEIVDAFRNIDIVVSTISDDRTTEAHQRSIAEDSHAIDRMPSTFTELAEARRYWVIIMRRSSHFLGTTWHRTQPRTLARDTKIKIFGSVLVTVGDTIHTTSAQVDDVVLGGERRHSAEIARWLQAFGPLFSKFSKRDSASGVREHVIATMLQIQALTGKITVAGVAFTQEILYDQFHADFESIVQLAEDVASVSHASSSSSTSSAKTDYWTGSFLFDLGLVAPLFNLLLRCRDFTLRYRAIKILENWHVEGWWDPLLVVAIAKVIMDVEKEGMEESGVGHGFVPEEKRAILTAKRHVPPKRELLVQCVQRTREGLQWTERMVYW